MVWIMLFKTVNTLKCPLCRYSNQGASCSVPLERGENRKRKEVDDDGWDRHTVDHLIGSIASRSRKIIPLCSTLVVVSSFLTVWDFPAEDITTDQYPVDGGLELVAYRRLKKLLSGTGKITLENGKLCWKMPVLPNPWLWVLTGQNMEMQTKYWKTRAILKGELTMKLSGKRRNKWRSLILLLSACECKASSSKNCFRLFLSWWKKGDLYQLHILNIKQHDNKTGNIFSWWPARAHI